MNTDKETNNGMFKERQFAALKRAIATGIDQLDGGHYQVYDDANVMQLAEDVGRAGRKRMASTQQNLR
jgi:hypothetical protein